MSITWRPKSTAFRILFQPNRKHRVSITRTNSLMLFKEIVAVYSEIHTKHKTGLYHADKLQCQSLDAGHQQHLGFCSSPTENIASPLQGPTV
jgi:hypothetical protein